MLHDAELVNQVLRVFLEEVEKALFACSPGAPSDARFGAVSFVHRFGAALNSNLHFHCCVIEGLFSTEGEGLRFHPAQVNETAIARVQRQTRRRVLRLFARRKLLCPEAVGAMQEWEHGGGFSLDASVRIAANDRHGLARLLRYGGRGPFAAERLEALDAQRLIDPLPKPGPDGRTQLILTPLQLIGRSAALVPPPRQHRHRYYGVLAPNSPLRPAVTALAPAAVAPTSESRPAVATAADDLPQASRRSPARSRWAMRRARLFEAVPLPCPHGGAERRIIAFLTAAVNVRALLQHLGEPATPPRLAQARGPPAWDEDAGSASHWEDDSAVPGDPLAQPESAYEFDQRVTW